MINNIDNKPEVSNKTKLICVIILSIIGVYIGFEYVLPLFIPFIFAYFIAWLLLPIVRFLNKKIHMPKLAGGIIALVFLSTLLVWGLCCLCKIIIEQIIALLKNMPIYLTVLTGHIDRVCGGCDKYFGVRLGTIKEYLYNYGDTFLDKIKNNIMPVITSEGINIMIGIAGVLGIVLIILVSIILLIKDDEKYEDGFRNCIYYPDIHIVTSKLSNMGIAYLRTQAIMAIIIGTICTAGLLLIKNEYALLIGIGIGIFDAFPILGSGIILVPWGIISLFNKDIFSAAVLLTVYLICQLTRQFLEPKLLGSRIGIKPVYTLMAIYVGLKVFGIAGFILGPIGLTIIVTVVNECKKRLFSGQESAEE